MQRFDYWSPVPQPPDYLSGAFVVHAGANRTFVVCDGKFGNGKCLVLAFGRIEEILISEEFAREWAPELQSSQPKGAPFLMVHESAWAKSSDQTATFGQPLHHFCIISGDCCVEVLAPEHPVVKWAEPSAVDTLFQQADSLGEA